MTRLAARSRSKEDKIDKDVNRDLKKIVHRHLRSVSAGVEAARTTRDAADAAEHALGYTQHISAEVGNLAEQTEKQADRVVAAAKLTAEARDAMRAALQQSSQIVDYNTHAARAVAQDAGFVTTASSAIAKYLDGIFKDRKTVRKVSAQVTTRLRKDEKKADSIVARLEQDEAKAISSAKYAARAQARSARWSHRSGVAAKTAASAADHALQGEQAALQSGMKALGYARSARDADGYAQDYADEAEKVAMYERQLAGEASQFAQPWRSAGFWGPQTAPRPYNQMPYWRNARAYPSADAYQYSGYYPYTPFGSAPYGYAQQGTAASPLKRSKELVDSVVVLMQHLTRSLEAAGPNCQLVNGYLASYQRGMASYRAQGVGLGNLLSDEDMKLVEQYAEVQVQSFASDLEDAMANAESYCGLAGGVSLANGAPTVALGQVTTTHANPYMRCCPSPVASRGWPCRGLLHTHTRLFAGAHACMCCHARDRKSIRQSMPCACACVALTARHGVVCGGAAYRPAASSPTPTVSSWEATPRSGLTRARCSSRCWRGSRAPLPGTLWQAATCRARTRA